MLKEHEIEQKSQSKIDAIDSSSAHCTVHSAHCTVNKIQQNRIETHTHTTNI